MKLHISFFMKKIDFYYLLKYHKFIFLFYQSLFLDLGALYTAFFYGFSPKTT